MSGARLVNWLSPAFNQGVWNRTRQRFLSLALAAVFLQATVPYLSAANCPVYAATRSAVKSGAHAPSPMMADCALFGVHAEAPASGQPDKDPHHSQVHSCSLCAVMAAFHKYVAAGLVSLPPPAPESQSNPIAVGSTFAPAPVAAHFSARAPPLSI